MSLRDIVIHGLLSVLRVGLVSVMVLGIFPPAGSQSAAEVGPHPRLFFDASDVPALETAALGTHSEIWQGIQGYVDSLRGTAPLAAAPETDDEEAYVNTGLGLIPLAFVCTVAGQAEACDLARNYIVAYSRWTHWGPAERRGRGLGYMVLGNAIAYDWLYNILTPEEQQAVRASLSVHAQEIYDASRGAYRDEWGNWWGKSYLQNHYWIMHSALGVAGLALVGESAAVPCAVTANTNVNRRAGPGTSYDIVGRFYGGQTADTLQQVTGQDGYTWWQLGDGSWVRADLVTPAASCQNPLSDPQAWIDLAREKLGLGRDILESTGDGTWHEGMHYQSMTLATSLPFWISLRRVQKVDLIPYRYLENYAYWRVYNHLPGTTQFLLSFGDYFWQWGNTFIPQAVLRFVASETGDGHAEWMARQLTQVDGRAPTEFTSPWYVFEFLAYNPAIAPVPPDDLPGHRTFEDLQGVIWRTGWQPEDLVFGLKTGPYGGRFAADTFTQGLYPWEQPCEQTGCSLLTGHDHDDTNGFYLWGAGHWLAPETVAYERTETSAHNTLLIDGQGQYRPPDSHTGMVPEDYVGRDGFLVASASTPDFDYVAADATRRYAIDGLQQIRRYALFLRPGMILMLDRVAADAPHQVEWICHFGQDASVEGQWIRGSAGDGTILGVAVVSPAQFSAALGNDDNAFVRTQPAAPGADTRLIHLLYPTTDAGWDAKPTASLVEDDGAVALVRITAQDGSAQSDEVLFNTSGVEASLDAYVFDGQVAAIHRGAEGQIERLFVYGGTRLAEGGAGGQVLVDQLNPEQALEVIYDGENLRLYGEISTAITVYAPGIKQVFVNDVTYPFTSEQDQVTLARS